MSLHIHTRRVNFLRTVLPGIAMLGLITVIAWPSINEFKIKQLSKLSLTHARIESIALTTPAAGQPAQLQVTNPEFTGRDEQGRPYVINATRVMQGLQIGSAMTLEKPVAKLVLDSTTKQEVTLQGATGVYDPKNKTLSLDKQVVLTHSDGYTMNMDDLFIDLTKGLSTTKTPVTGVGPLGQISGESLELRDKGNHIILHGKSKVILTPKSAS